MNICSIRGKIPNESEKKDGDTRAAVGYNNNILFYVNP
jgi:hypothetical protein